MTVKELNQDQLDELKQTYAVTKANVKGKELSWNELIESQNIPNEVIYKVFESVDFTDDDFFCTAGGNK